jgi:hypothetical protein
MMNPDSIKPARGAALSKPRRQPVPLPAGAGIALGVVSGAAIWAVVLLVLWGAG